MFLSLRAFFITHFLKCVLMMEPWSSDMWYDGVASGEAAAFQFLYSLTETVLLDPCEIGVVEFPCVVLKNRLIDVTISPLCSVCNVLHLITRFYFL